MNYDEDELPPELDTIRVAVVRLEAVLTATNGRPLRLVNGTKCVVPLLSCQPGEAGVSIMAGTLIAAPELRVGTIDEHVASYREHLEAAIAAGLSEYEGRVALEATEAAFAGSRSGVISPMFGGGDEG